MNEELIELLMDYIDAKVEDAIDTHKTDSHGGCYYNYFNSAGKVKEKIYDLLKK